MSFYGQILNNIIYGIDKLGTVFKLKSSKDDDGYSISLNFESGEEGATEVLVNSVTIPAPSYNPDSKSINLTPDVSQENEEE